MAAGSHLEIEKSQYLKTVVLISAEFWCADAVALLMLRAIEIPKLPVKRNMNMKQQLFIYNVNSDVQKLQKLC